MREHEFLPAALEIQARPPLPASRLLIWAIVAFFAAAVGWACLGRVDIVAVAPGKIVPSSRVKAIQALEAGVIAELRVGEGDHVERGELLIALDSTRLGAERQRLHHEGTVLALERSRLTTALARAADGGTADRLVEPPAAATALQRDRYLQRARQELTEFRAALAGLGEERAERKAELRAVAAGIDRLEQTLPMVGEMADAVGSLMARRHAARTDWLQLERVRVEQQKELEAQRHGAERLTAALAGIEQRRERLIAETQSRLRAELAEVEAGLHANRQNLIKIDRRLALRRLTAPVGGQVQQLAVHTVGGVVSPAQVLMLIVPEDDPVEVEALIRNRDIGFVTEGQHAEVKVETFPFTKYGTLDGTLAVISDDAVQDDEAGLNYLARVRLAQTELGVNGRRVALSPGMAVTAEFHTGRRRVIEFVLSPLLRHWTEAAKER